MSLIALAATGIATAKDAPKKTAPAPEAAPAQAAPAAAAPAPAAPAPAAPAPLNAEEAKKDASYALGYRTGGTFGQEFGRFGVKLDDLEMETFIQGFRASVKGGKPELEEARLQAAMTAFGEMLQQREKTTAAENLEKGKKLLAENGKREGVKTLESGLQYEVLAKGGESKYVAPKEGEPEKQFMVNYKGSLIDGTEFDASPKGAPVAMTLSVVDGFKEALGMMPVGAKWKLFLPSKLAYGEERRSAQISPNSVLIFELELVEIKDAPPAPAGGGLPLPLPEGQ